MLPADVRLNTKPATVAFDILNSDIIEVEMAFAGHPFIGLSVKVYTDYAED